MLFPSEDSCPEISGQHWLEADGCALHIPPPIIATPVLMICDVSPNLFVTVQGRHFVLDFGFGLGSVSAGDDVG